MKANRIVVTGMGVVSPLGNSPQELWSALKAGECAIETHEHLAQEGFLIPKYALCKGEFGSSKQRGQNMAIYAAKQSLSTEDISHKTVAVCIGTSMGESAVFEECEEVTEEALKEGTANVFAKAIQESLKLKGPTYAYGAACAAGNYAIGTAADLLRYGKVDMALAGGVEPFSKIALTGFIRSRAMSPERCTPFDKNRQGMQIGEGAAILCLEREADALERGANIYAVIGELGLSCDAYHPTSPKKDGSGMAVSIEEALKQNKSHASEVDWISAHGTGTVISDLAESQALHRVFKSSIPPVTGFKGALGHTLGAASAIEALLCVMSIEKREILQTVGYENLDETLELPIVSSPIDKELNMVINCAYGFGGVNSCLILEKP